MKLLTLAFKIFTPSIPLVTCPLENQLLYEKSHYPETTLLGESATATWRKRDHVEGHQGTRDMDVKVTGPSSPAKPQGMQQKNCLSQPSRFLTHRLQTNKMIEILSHEVWGWFVTQQLIIEAEVRRPVRRVLQKSR